MSSFPKERLRVELPWFSLSDGTALAAVSLWGIAVPLIKASLPQVDPLAFVTIRTLLASSLLFCALVVLEGNVQVQRKHWGALILLGATGFGLTQVFFLVGLSFTSVSHSTVLGATSPAFAAVMAFWWTSERLRPLRVGGIALSLIGVGLLVNSGEARLDSGILLGDAITLLSAISWAGYSVLSKPLLSVYSPLKLLAYGLLLGNVLLIPLGFMPVLNQTWEAVSLVGWFGLAFSALMGMVLANMLWLNSVAKIGPTRTLLYQYWTPLVATFIAVVLFREAVSWGQALGAGVVLTGIGLAASSS